MKTSFKKLILNVPNSAIKKIGVVVFLTVSQFGLASALICPREIAWTIETGGDLRGRMFRLVTNSNAGPEQQFAQAAEINDGRIRLSPVEAKKGWSSETAHAEAASGILVIPGPDQLHFFAAGSDPERDFKLTVPLSGVATLEPTVLRAEVEKVFRTQVLPKYLPIHLEKTRRLLEKHKTLTWEQFVEFTWLFALDGIKAEPHLFTIEVGKQKRMALIEFDYRGDGTFSPQIRMRTSDDDDAIGILSRWERWCGRTAEKIRLSEYTDREKEHRELSVTGGMIADWFRIPQDTSHIPEDVLRGLPLAEGNHLLEFSRPRGEGTNNKSLDNDAFWDLAKRHLRGELGGVPMAPDQQFVVDFKSILEHLIREGRASLVQEVQ